VALEAVVAGRGVSAAMGEPAVARGVSTAMGVPAAARGGKGNEGEVRAAAGAALSLATGSSVSMLLADLARDLAAVAAACRKKIIHVIRKGQKKSTGQNFHLLEIPFLTTI